MYHFIINPGSRTGKGIKAWHVIEDHLIDHKINYNYYFTKPDLSANKIVSKISKKPGDKKIIILGGDGTINEAINGLEDFQLNNTYIGYIPTGSSNDFARSLMLSKDPLVGLEQILSSKEFLALDLGKVKVGESEEYKFIVSSGAGFDATIVKSANRSKLKTFLNLIGLGKFIYIIKAVSSLFLSPYNQATVIIDNQEVKSYKKLFFLISMNHKYEGGGIVFAPDANPQDGKLSVCIVHGLSRWKLLLMLVHVLVGKHEGLKGVELFNCSSMEVKLENTWNLHTDGEFLGTYPAYSISCIPEKLKLLV